jgi:hypothetical protein
MDNGQGCVVIIPHHVVKIVKVVVCGIFRKAYERTSHMLRIW